MTVADKTFTNPFDFIPEAVSGQALGSAANRWELFGGQMLLNAQPVFSVDMTGDMVNVAVGISVDVIFDQEITDVGGNFNVGTYTFTAPVAGFYALCISVRFDGVDSAATNIRASIITSNRNYDILFPTIGLDQDVDFLTLQNAHVCDMDAGDTAKCTIGINGGAVQVDIDAGPGTRFTGYLLG